MSDQAVQYKPTLIDRANFVFSNIAHKVKSTAVEIALQVIRWAARDSNYKKHARAEFLALGYTPLDQTQEEDPNKWIQQNIMDLLSVFATQGHSGSSAPYCVHYFEKLASFKPLSPIECGDNEWNEVGDDTFQNIRLSSVFKKGRSGRPYYLNAIVWRNQNGCTYAGSALDENGNTVKSNQFVKLPFTPKTFYIDVIEKEIAPDDWEFHIKDGEQLAEVFEYYAPHPLKPTTRF